MLKKMPNSKRKPDENWKKLLQLHPELKKKNKKQNVSDQMTLVDKVVSAPSNGKPEMWFDGVDEIFLENDIRPDSTGVGANATNPLVKAHSFDGLTKIVAMDCEMVGVGKNGEDSVLARISLVNHFGNCIYDKYVKPREPVVDYRTQFSGIRPADIEKGEDFLTVQKEVHEILKKRILVGHALHNDLKVLFLDHPRSSIRDTSRYKPFKRLFGGRTPALRRLADKILGATIQDGEHDSVQDAQAAMRLYTMHRKHWEERRKKWRLVKHAKRQVKTEDKRGSETTASGDAVLKK